ncbi:hypothetical protein FOZ63_025523, partial [Perkinsus olseni]
MSCHFTPTTEEMIQVIKDDLRQKRKMKLEKANAAAAESQAKRRNVLRQMLGVSKNAEGEEDTQLPMEAAAIGNYITCEKAPDGHTYTILSVVGGAPQGLRWVRRFPENEKRREEVTGRALTTTRVTRHCPGPRGNLWMLQFKTLIRFMSLRVVVSRPQSRWAFGCLDTPAGGNAVQTAGSESSSSEGGWEEANAFSKTSHFDAWEVGSSASNHRPSCSSAMSQSRQSSVAYSDTDALEVDDIGHPLNTPSPYWIPKGHAGAPTTTVAAKDSGRSEKLMEFLVAVSAVRITGLDRTGDYCLRLEWGDGGRHRYQTKVCRHTDQPEWPEVVLRFRWTTSSLQDRNFVLKLIRVDDDDVHAEPRRGSAVSSIMSGVLNDITEQRESPEDERQHPPARKRMTVGSCCIAIEDIATGPVHHDMALVSEGYCSKAARVEMNISVDQMCDMQIYPIACLFEQNSNINFVFSGRTSESVADSQERSRSHTSSELAGGSSVVGLPTSLDSAVFGTHDTADLQRFEWKVSFVINNGERSKESSFPACWSEMCTDPLWDAVDETRLDKVLQQHVSEDRDDLAHAASPEDGKGANMSWITRMISEKLRKTNEIVSSSNGSSGASNTATCTAGNENSADDEITDMVTMAKKLVDDDDDGATGRADHSNGYAVTGRTLTQTLRASLRDLVTSDDIQQAALGLLSRHHLERLGQLSRKGCSIAPVLDESVLPIIQLRTTLENLNRHHIRIVAHCRDRTKTTSGDAIQGGGDTERIFGETWVPFSKIVRASVADRNAPVSSTTSAVTISGMRRSSMHLVDTMAAAVDGTPLDEQLTDRHHFQASVFKGHLQHAGHIVGTVACVFVFQNNPVLSQLAAGVRTERGIQRVSPIILGEVSRLVDFDNLMYFDDENEGSGNRIIADLPSQVRSIASNHKKLLELMFEALQSRSTPTITTTTTTTIPVEGMTRSAARELGRKLGRRSSTSTTTDRQRILKDIQRDLKACRSDAFNSSMPDSGDAA